MADLAKNLRKVRAEKGYTQKQVAGLLGTTRLSVWGMENGKKTVAAIDLYRLAQVYGKAVEDFFTEETGEPDVLHSFQKFGHPILSSFPRSSTRLLDPTNLVLQVLEKFPDPRFVEGLPVVFLTQSLNHDWLYLQSVRQGLQNRLGLVVDLTLQAFRMTGVAKDQKPLEKLLERLEKVKLSREDVFCGVLSDEDSLPHLRKMADPLSKKWNLLSNFPLDSVTRWVQRVKKT